jgi:hypothetical protein
VVNCFGYGKGRRICITRVPAEISIQKLAQFDRLLKEKNFINENPSYCIRKMQPVEFLTPVDSVKITDTKPITFLVFCVPAKKLRITVRVFVNTLKATIMPDVMVTYSPGVDLSTLFR